MIGGRLQGSVAVGGEQLHGLKKHRMTAHIHTEREKNRIPSSFLTKGNGGSWNTWKPFDCERGRGFPWLRGTLRHDFWREKQDSAQISTMRKHYHRYLGMEDPTVFPPFRCCDFQVPHTSCLGAKLEICTGSKSRRQRVLQTPKDAGTHSLLFIIFKPKREG